MAKTPEEHFVGRFNNSKPEARLINLDVAKVEAQIAAFFDMPEVTKKDSR